MRDLLIRFAESLFVLAEAVLEKLTGIMLSPVKNVALLAALSGFSSAQTDAGGPQSADGLKGGATASASASITPSPTAEINGTLVTFRPEFTVPAAADVGAPLIPTINDPEAKDPQALCPGYTASQVVNNELGFSASLTLAGPACNVYGNDIENLNFSVEWQSASRLSIRILPTYLDSSNESYYVLDQHTVPQPQADLDAASSIVGSDLSFTWSNSPSFSFSVYRASTSDMLFTTVGTKLVYEDQFIEFASELPENYNLYGLGETIHQFRLGNNLTRTLYAADVGDVIDA